MTYRQMLKTDSLILEIFTFLSLLLLSIMIINDGLKQKAVATQLDKSAVVTQATVTEKSITEENFGAPNGAGTSISYHVTYRFEANGQQVIEKVQSKTIYDTVRKEGKVNIRYLPQNPSINEVSGSNEYQKHASTAISFGSYFIIMAIIAALIFGPAWLKPIRFKLSPKETTQAKIVDRRILSSKSGKGGSSDTHYMTYRFETLEGKKRFEFEEEISEGFYNAIRKGTLLTVEYVIEDPQLARSSLPKVEKSKIALRIN